jgi:hypothetical protein
MGNPCSAVAALVLAALLAPPAASAGGDEPLSAEAAVKLRVAEAVGRPVDAVFSVEGRSGDWRFLCGRPVEPDGRPFDIERSRLASTEFGAYFCALVTLRSGDAEVVEFDIGSTDMPAVDWVRKYHLPMKILGTRP